ncbi:MAG: hypothetical protein GY711_00645 [bacterium]|nr:hypothetical protein [bacterium]
MRWVSVHGDPFGPRVAARGAPGVHIFIGPPGGRGRIAGSGRVFGFLLVRADGPHARPITQR